MSALPYIKRQAQADIEAFLDDLDPSQILPRYGEYGGPGWTGGEENGNNFDVEPSDSLDELFQKHDRAYGASNDLNDIIDADRQLVQDINNWQGSGNAFTDPALSSPGAIAAALGYAGFAKGVFIGKIGIYQLRSFAQDLGDDGVPNNSNDVPDSPNDPGDPDDPDPGDPNDPDNPDNPNSQNPWPPTPPSPPRDPLVLDLDGDGVELIALDDSAAHFDYDQDGFRESTGWLSPDDAFLVHDGNNNGAVDGISELFGSPDEDGFSALATFDSNNDGKIDASDSAFDALKLWRDLDGDGDYDAGEMFSLSGYDIVSISVNAAASNVTDEGNTIAFVGSYLRGNGQTGEAQAILFSTNRTVSVWEMPDEFEVSDLAARLPNLKGYGLLPDLLYSMTIDTGLEASVQQFVTSVLSLRPEEIRAEFTELLYQWAGVGDVSSGGRGPHVDGRSVAFIEKFFGDALDEEGHNQNIEQRFAAEIERSFESVLDTLLTRFLSQVPTSIFLLDGDKGALLGSPIFSTMLLGYNEELDQFEGSVDETIDCIVNFYHAQSEGGIDYLANAAVAVAGLAYEYFNNDHTKLSAYFADKLLAADSNNHVAVAVVEAIFSGTEITGGTDLGEMLSGTDDSDFFVGRQGDDTINGGEGSDTYVYSPGDGNDVYIEKGGLYNRSGADDKILLNGIDPADVTVARDGDDFVLVIAESSPGAGDGGTITLEGTGVSYYENGIERVLFDDGTIWSKNELRQRHFDGLSTDGDDTILGFNTEDTFEAGLGDDTINGGDGSDTYVYSRGDGDDVYIEKGGRYNRSGADDKVLLHGIDPADVTVARTGDDLVLVIAESSPGAGDGGTITLEGTGVSYYENGIEQVLFDDGTIWSKDELRQRHFDGLSTDGDDTILGFNTEDTFEAGLGDDTINGGDGSDTYVYSRGDGDDVYIEKGGRYNRSGADDKVLLHGIDPADVTVARTGDDLVLVIAESSPGAGDGGTVTLISTAVNYYENGIERVVFDDGTEWTKVHMRSIAVVYGTEGNDSLNGQDGVDDRIDGLAGNDTINGLGGDDMLVGGAGDDQLIGGAGADQLYGGDGDDTLVIDIDDTDWSGDAGYDTLIYDGNEDFSYALAQGEFEAVQSGGGNDSLYGTTDNNDMDGGAGDDIIFGYEGDDRLVGGAGDDFVTGGSGADTFVFADGEGVDWIDDFDVAEDKIDLSSVSGISDFNDVLALANDYGSGTTWITFDNDNEIRLEGVALASLSASNFIFAA